MLFNKLIFFSFFIFATKCLTITEADYVKLNISRRLQNTVNDIKTSNTNEDLILSLSEQQSTPLSTNSDSEVATPISSTITVINGSKVNEKNFSIKTDNSAIKKSNATSERTYEEIATTNNPTERRKFRPSAYYENGHNYEAALVIPETPKPILNAATSTTENNLTELNSDLENETIPSTPRILTFEEQCHPIIFDFITRIKRVNMTLSKANKTSSKSGSPTVHPVDTSYFNLRDVNNPKYKYFEDFYRVYLNITDLNKTYRDSSFIRAYYAQKEFPTAIDYSKEDSLILTKPDTKKDDPPLRIPFNTKDYYSPKYEQLSKFHYDFFPRYVDGKLVVPIHA